MKLMTVTILSTTGQKIHRILARTSQKRLRSQNKFPLGNESVRENP